MAFIFIFVITGTLRILFFVIRAICDGIMCKGTELVGWLVLILVKCVVYVVWFIFCYCFCVLGLC